MGVPVQPVAIKIPFRWMDCSWCTAGPGASSLLLRAMCQFVNFMQLTYLPVHTPTVVSWMSHLRLSILQFACRSECELYIILTGRKEGCAAFCKQRPKSNRRVSWRWCLEPLHRGQQADGSYSRNRWKRRYFASKHYRPNRLLMLQGPIFLSWGSRYASLSARVVTISFFVCFH